MRCLRTCAPNVGGARSSPRSLWSGGLASPARARPRRGACAPGFFGMRRAFRFRPGSVPAPVRARRPSLGGPFPPAGSRRLRRPARGRPASGGLPCRASPLPPAPPPAPAAPLLGPLWAPVGPLAAPPPSLLPARGGAVAACAALLRSARPGLRALRLARAFAEAAGARGDLGRGPRSVRQCRWCGSKNPCLTTGRYRVIVMLQGAVAAAHDTV